ncbi:MAG: hypothetical protein GX663_03510 [Clostridiales bacterium]|nr:hypothetical protein [Clostridiales bacterium]
MKKILRTMITVLALLILPSLFFCGCGEDKSGNTINEPEITGEYLAEEYAQQLMTDGAITMLGYVNILKNNGSSYSVEITEKEVVPSADYDDGYYIADTNLVMDATLGTSARITCLEADGYAVKTADEFIEDQGDSSPNEVHIYTVYMMGDSVELIVEKAPEDVELK